MPLIELPEGHCAATWQEEEARTRILAERMEWTGQRRDMVDTATVRELLGCQPVPRRRLTRYDFLRAAIAEAHPTAPPAVFVPRRRNGRSVRVLAGWKIKEAA